MLDRASRLGLAGAIAAVALVAHAQRAHAACGPTRVGAPTVAPDTMYSADTRAGGVWCRVALTTGSVLSVGWWSNVPGVPDVHLDLHGPDETDATWHRPL